LNRRKQRKREEKRNPEFRIQKREEKKKPQISRIALIKKKRV